MNRFFPSIRRISTTAKPTLMPTWRSTLKKLPHNPELPEGLTGVPLPDIVHAEAEPHNGRTIVVGDVHGCFDEMEKLLQESQFDEKEDRLIFVGDLMSKGNKPLQVLRFVRESGALCIRGNHDDDALKKRKMLLQGDLENEQQYYEYTKEFTADDLEFLQQLPYTISLPEIQTIIVHAGLVPGVALKDQIPADMFTMRNLLKEEGVDVDAVVDNVIKAEEPSPTLNWKATRSDKEGVEWAAQWTGPETLIFGHDAKRGLQQHPFAIGLDTGCCYGKKLTAIILPERQLVSVDAFEMYTIPGGKPPKETIAISSNDI